MDLPSRVRCRWGLPLSVAILAVASSTSQSDGFAGCAANVDEQVDPTRTDVARSSLPPRALFRIGTTDLRTQDNISPIAFSPDGRFIAAADFHAASPCASIFDVRSGRRVAQLIVPGGKRSWVESLAFSPDGTKLLWGEMRGEVALWDVASDRLLFRRKFHNSSVSAVGFSPDGSLLATAAQDGVIRLRSVARPEQIVRDLMMPPKPAPVAVLVQNAQAVEPANRARQEIGCLAFSPDGTRLVAGAQFTAIIVVWRVSDGKALRQLGPAAANGLHTVLVTPDGRQILSAGYRTVRTDRSKNDTNQPSVPMADIRFWDIKTGECLREVTGADELGSAYATLSVEGPKIAVTDFRGFRILDTATGKLKRTVDVPGPWDRAPSFSPDGTIVALPDQNSIALFEVSTGKRLHHDAGTPVGSAMSAAWSTSGDRIVTGHSDGFVRAWDALTGKLVWHKLLAPAVSMHGLIAQPTFAGFSHDGKLVVAAGRRDDPVGHLDGIIKLYDAASGRTVREYPQNEIRGAVLAADGRMAVLATAAKVSGGTRLVGVEFATGRQRWTNPPEDPPTAFTHVATMQFEKNSPWFHAALGIGRVMRLNSLTGHAQHEFLADWRTAEQQKAGEPEWPEMSEATFSPDGRILVSSHMEWVYVWDVASGTMRRKIRLPHEHRCNVALAPDGRTLATSDRHVDAVRGEDTIRLYDIETGDQILNLEFSDGPARVMVFSPDGKRLLTGFGRGSGIVWDVRHSKSAP